jgi:transcriptional regulator with XRE-family HTH domain
MASRMRHNRVCNANTLAKFVMAAYTPIMQGADALYKLVGVRIRAARERRAERLSQANLAKMLGVSRASIVNIEAGRQHAPLALLWNIAHALDVELSMLIPNRAELLGLQATAPLKQAMLNHIKLKAAGNTTLERDLANWVGDLLGVAATKSKTRDQP